MVEKGKFEEFGLNLKDKTTKKLVEQFGKVLRECDYVQSKLAKLSDRPETPSLLADVLKLQKDFEASNKKRLEIESKLKEKGYRPSVSDDQELYGLAMAQSISAEILTDDEEPIYDSVCSEPKTTGTGVIEDPPITSNNNPLGLTMLQNRSNEIRELGAKPKIPLTRIKYALGENEHQGTHSSRELVEAQRIAQGQRKYNEQSNFLESERLLRQKQQVEARQKELDRRRKTGELKDQAEAGSPRIESGFTHRELSYATGDVHNIQEKTPYPLPSLPTTNQIYDINTNKWINRKSVDRIEKETLEQAKELNRAQFENEQRRIEEEFFQKQRENRRPVPNTTHQVDVTRENVKILTQKHQTMLEQNIKLQNMIQQLNHGKEQSDRRFQELLNDIENIKIQEQRSQPLDPLEPPYNPYFGPIPMNINHQEIREERSRKLSAADCLRMMIMLDNKGNMFQWTKTVAQLASKCADDQKDVLITGIINTKLSDEIRNNILTMDINTADDLIEKVREVTTITHTYPQLLIELSNCKQNKNTVSKYILKFNILFEEAKRAKFKENNRLGFGHPYDLGDLGILSKEYFTLGLEKQLSFAVMARGPESLAQAQHIAREIRTSQEQYDLHHGINVKSELESGYSSHKESSREKHTRKLARIIRRPEARFPAIEPPPNPDNHIRRPDNARSGEKVNQCYKCGRIGHISPNCPNFRKGQSQKRPPQKPRVHNIETFNEPNATPTEQNNEQIARVHQQYEQEYALYEPTKSDEDDYETVTEETSEDEE